MAGPMLEKMCPFFIVSGVEQSIAFYRDQLGFETWHQQPQRGPFFAILGRDGAMLFLKSGKAGPLPNSKRDAEMRWDAYVSVNDPDALAAEFVDRGVAFSAPLTDTHDGLRGFEITDPDGYVLFFWRPRQRQTNSN
jgi:catechol 2,3-dioxygenase-like lactoylglutathione lyase family enzyme